MPKAWPIIHEVLRESVRQKYAACTERHQAFAVAHISPYSLRVGLVY